MAWSFVSVVNGTGNKTAGTAATATVTASIGDTLIVACCCDDVSGADAIGTGAITATGNTFTRIASNQGQTAAADVCSAVFACVLTSALSAGTVTFTPNASSAAKDLTVYRFTGGSITDRITTQTATGANSNTGSTLTHTGPINGDLVFGLAGVQGNTSIDFTVGTDTDTTNGSWSTGVLDGVIGGGASSNVAFWTQYKIVTADGSQSWSFGTSGAAIYRNILLCLQPAPGVIFHSLIVQDVATVLHASNF